MTDRTYSEFLCRNYILNTLDDSPSYKTAKELWEFWTKNISLKCLVSKRCVWYVGRDGTERDEAFRPAFGAPKMGGMGCSTGQILSVFAFHLPPWNGFVPHLWNAMFYHFKTNIPHVFFKNYTFVPSRPIPFRPVPSRSVPFHLRTKRTLREQVTFQRHS
ncbi:hypothetical protein DVH24_031192 [Malus domestica]|uniref:Uncharacterized protein n=1 Tax=Malus domestica TaxID=3750 RepID=A0A498HCT9_MALDO|nr:hypothetical protein DVH24_031192 [Malus domestica]